MEGILHCDGASLALRGINARSGRTEDSVQIPGVEQRLRPCDVNSAVSGRLDAFHDIRRDRAEPFFEQHEDQVRSALFEALPPAFRRQPMGHGRERRFSILQCTCAEQRPVAFLGQPECVCKADRTIQTDKKVFRTSCQFSQSWKPGLDGQIYLVRDPHCEERSALRGISGWRTTRKLPPDPGRRATISTTPSIPRCRQTGHGPRHPPGSGRTVLRAA